MFDRSSLQAAWFAGAVSLGVGCGSSEKQDVGAEPKSEGGSSGGSVTTGGRPAAGGSAGDSGAPSTGGRDGTGGRDASGGNAMSGGAAGEAVGGAGGEDSGGSGGASDAGQCREVARYRVSTGDYSLSNYDIARIPGGFLLGADPNSSAPILIADETGKTREIPRELADQNPSVVIGEWFAAGTASEPRFLNIRRVDDPDVNRVYVGYFFVQSFLESGVALGEERQVLEIFMRGTAMNHFARSYDGERVALGNVEPVVRDPRMVLVSKDGEPVSDEVRVLDTGDSPLIDCFEVRGTLHGAIGVASDRGLEQTRIVEIGAAGEIVQEITYPKGGCPAVWSEPTGIYVSFGGSLEFEPLDIYRLADGAFTQVLSLPGPTSDQSYGWFSGGDEPLLTHRIGAETSFVRVKDGPVALSGAFSGDLLASPLDGRIFFVTEEEEDHAVSIVEVECGPAE
jgi:hypothetical protein